MIEFHDFDPANPYDLKERHTISGNIIQLDHLPLKGSVSIEGFTEVETTPLQGQFLVDYGLGGNYRTSLQTIRFAPGYEGIEVTVSYKGIGTLLRAVHMNEIRAFMETGASELAARLLVQYKEAAAEIIETHCNHIVTALEKVATAINENGGSSGMLPGSYDIAEDDEADAALDEYFDGDVEQTGLSLGIATDAEADTMLDEVFSTGSTQG